MKYCENPDNTETAGSNKGNDHGEEGIAHSSHTSYHDVHQTTEEIGCTDKMHPVQAVLDHFRVGRVNAKKLFSEENKPVSHDKSNGTYENQTDRKDLFHALSVSCSHVLTGKA